MAAKKDGKRSKAAFVRALPATLSAAEVVERAKAAGIPLEVGYVYNIRSSSKALGKRGGSRTTVGPRARSTAGRGSPSDTSPAEALLKAVGAELGLARAVQILESERARVRAAVGR
jgi:hypothetical protein